MPSWLYEKENGIAVLTRNSSEACNAANTNLIMELDTMIDLMARDSQVRVLILTSETVDGDISSESEMNRLKFEQFLHLIKQVMNKLAQMPKPKIFALDGRAFSLVLEMALACDFRIASQRSLLGQPSMQLNVLPGGNGYLRLIRLIGTGRANVLAFTDEILVAAKAMEYGLVTQVAPDDYLLDEARKLATQIIFGSSGMTKGWENQFSSNNSPAKCSDRLSELNPKQALFSELPINQKIVFMEKWKKPNKRK